MMKRCASLLLVILVCAATATWAQRTGVSLLNSKTDITDADTNTILVGQSDGTWAEVPVPTTCPTPGGLVFNGGTLACSTPAPTRYSYLASGRPLFATAITGDVFFNTDGSSTATEADMGVIAPVAGVCDTFCCDCSVAPGASGRTFAFRVGGFTSNLNVSYAAGTSGVRCDTPTDVAAISAGDLYDFLSNNPASGGSDTRCSCSCRLRVP